jgi:hypothetical protein
MDSKKQAQGIASLGRYGDTTLMHMRPDEVEQLTAISRANGGDITINPKTGMPEAFLGDFVSGLLPTAAGIAAGSMFGPAGGAIAGGLTSFMQGKRDPLSIGMGALGGYGGANIAGTLKGMAGAAPIPPGGSEAVNLGTTASQNAYGTTVAGQGSFNPALTTAGGQGIPMSNYNPALNTNFGRVGPRNFGAVDRNVASAGNIGPGYDATGANLGSFTPEQSYGYGSPTNNLTADFNTIQKPLGSDTYAFKQSQLEEGMSLGQKAARAGDSLKRGFSAAVDNPTEFFERMGGKTYGPTGEVTKEGSALIGGIKTAAPVAAAGAEAYMKDAYEDRMVRPEEDTRRYYDPSRTLNLGMDTGLRLLAKGGKVEKFAEGNVVRDQSYYGINPQYQNVGPSVGGFGIYPSAGYMGGGQQTRVPVKGFVDVGGKFKADPQGNITDVEYEDRFKYVTEGVAKPEDSSGDMTDLNASAAGGAGGINPAVALQAAQGYADTQQSDINQQGLGGLRKGGAIKYQQGGKTTAEMNTAKAATPPPATTMDLMLAKKQEEEAAAQGIPAGLNIQAIQAQAQQEGMADGGIAELTPDDGKMLNGEGDGVSDDIPAMIEGEQEAALSDGEFIVPARIVSELGNGSSDAGAQKLYSMIDRIQAARKQTMGDNKQYAKDTNAERFLPA